MKKPRRFLLRMMATWGRRSRLSVGWLCVLCWSSEWIRGFCKFALVLLNSNQEIAAPLVHGTSTESCTARLHYEIWWRSTVFWVITKLFQYDPGLSVKFATDNNDIEIPHGPTRNFISSCHLESATLARNCKTQLVTPFLEQFWSAFVFQRCQRAGT